MMAYNVKMFVKQCASHVNNHKYMHLMGRYFAHNRQHTAVTLLGNASIIMLPELHAYKQQQTPLLKQTPSVSNTLIGVNLNLFTKLGSTHQLHDLHELHACKQQQQQTHSAHACMHA